MRIFLLSLFCLFPLATSADLLDAPTWRSYQAQEGALTQFFRPGAQPGLKPGAPDGDMHRLLQSAQELVGTPYRWGGTSAKTGFDCSGLLVYLYRSVADQRLPRTTRSMIARRDATIARHELQPGDAVFFSHNGSDRVSHVGLYIGDNRFIHAPSTGKKIRIDSLASPYWKRAYVTARNFSG